MPYVEVWVDEVEGQNDEEIRRLESQIDEALVFLRAGMADEAICILDDSERCNRRFREQVEIVRRYRDWKAGKLEGFVPPSRAGSPQ